jgi:hypothetical protein
MTATPDGAFRSGRAILLKTATPDFLEFVGNGKRYAVPAYQRDYSWDDEHWDDLWNDILALRDDPASRHYMGAVVVQAKSDREFLVIDGQQRLATLSILALVIIGKLKQLADSQVDSENNRERSAGLRSRFIGEKDPASLVESSKLTLNSTDNPFYQDYLVQLRTPRNPRGMPKSNRQMWRCFQWFSKQIDSIEEYKRNGEALAHLLNEVVARRLMFILITVDNELNAYTVFETLNARGLELSATDLLKNYLFSRVRVPNDLESLQRRWLRMIQTVSQESFPDFLRYHLLCEQPKVRSNRLFQMTREKVTTPEDVFNLLDALEGRCELYAALADATHEYWLDFPNAKPLIRERILLRSQQTMPMLFAAWEKFPPDDFVRLLKLANVLTFRFSTVSNLNSNELEPVYHRAAKAILTGAAASPRDVFELCRGIYVEDKLFRQNFENYEVRTSGPGKKLAKYILCRLESDLSNADIDHETDSSTIEHILPENPAEAWAAVIPEQDWPRRVYRLGNLTLLEPRANRSVGNGLIGEKLATFASSRYALARRIADDCPEEWNAATIDSRQNWMASRAVHLWRADFAD